VFSGLSSSEDNKGPIDLDRVWRSFAQGGYKGYMSAEYEGEGRAERHLQPLAGVTAVTSGLISYADGDILPQRTRKPNPKIFSRREEVANWWSSAAGPQPNMQWVFFRAH
jgi:hypothetical protein